MDGLPPFLESFQGLSDHFDQHFESLDGNKRGDLFLSMVRKLVPLTDEGREFGEPEVSERKSHDDGVDLFTATNEKKQVLCVQSKYKIREKIDFDAIISKFEHYESKQQSVGARETPLFHSLEAGDGSPSLKFMIVCLNKLEGILAAYNSSRLSSKQYYQKLLDQKRIVCFDGPRILGLLQNLYRKAYLLPTEVELTATHGWLSIDSVRLGTIRGGDLLKLYEQHGDSLFFENIRDFLGVTSGKKAHSDRATVNDEIIRTIKEEPQKLLERNNGITFRAQKLTVLPDNKFLLTDAAIVNGCQTTMCLVRCGEKGSDSLVQVKIVVTDEAWDIAKSTNYQNHVAVIELDLAKYLRPQITKKMAADLGYAYGDPTASGILDTIYQSKLSYDEMRALFLGIFSRSPKNMFENNYTEVRTDILDVIHRKPEEEKEIYSTLFRVLEESRKANAECEQTFNGPEYSQLFNRFFNDSKPQYRSFLAVLTLCGTHRIDISERTSDPESEAKRTLEFFDMTARLLDNEPEAFRKNFNSAFHILATSTLEGKDSDEEISRKMHTRIKDTQFKNHYMKVLMDIDRMKASAR
jgi:hypothetical protein